MPLGDHLGPNQDIGFTGGEFGQDSIMTAPAPSGVMVQAKDSGRWEMIELTPVILLLI